MLTTVRTVAAAALMLAVTLHPSAQAPAPGEGASIPRLASGAPDLRGVWMPPYVPDMTRNGRGQRGYAEPPRAEPEAVGSAGWKLWNEQTATRAIVDAIDGAEQVVNVGDETFVKVIDIDLERPGFGECAPVAQPPLATGVIGWQPFDCHPLALADGLDRL